MKRFFLASVVALAACGSAQAALLPAPVAWWAFDNDGVDDGRIHDQGTNNLDLAVVENNNHAGQSAKFSSAAREVGTNVSSLPGQAVRYVDVGAPFPGSGEAWLNQGAVHRNYPTVPGDLANQFFNSVRQQPISPAANGSLIRDNRTSSAALQVINPAVGGIQTANDINFVSPLLRENNTTHTMTTAFWLNLPDRVGSVWNLQPENDFDGVTSDVQRRYENNFANRITLINFSGGTADPEGHIELRTVKGANEIFNESGSVILDQAEFDNPTYTLQITAQSGQPKIASNTKFHIDEWHHFAVVYEGARTLVYQNGELMDTLPTGISASDIIGGLRIGRFNAGNPLSGNFIIDDMGHWQEALTADEVKHIFTHGIREGLTREVQIVPEPSTLIGLAIGGIALLRRRRHLA